MTRIERVDVEGFKAIRSLDLEPTAINVITGRNNTGKTSLLEAIEIAFNPTAIEKFDSHIDTLVNVDYARTTIDIQTEEGIRTVVLYHPDQERARDILTNAAVDSVRNSAKRWEENPHLDFAETDAIDADFREIIAEGLETVAMENIADRIVIVSVDGSEYEYVHPSGAVADFFKEISGRIRQHVLGKDRPDEDREQGILNDFTMDVGFSFRRPFVRSNFVGDEPQPLDTVISVDVSDLTRPPRTNNDEVDAVKIDDVEEFLIEKHIVKNLRNFDIDYLVFADEAGEKYSVPYEFMGEGFRAIVGVVWELLDDEASKSVVLFEEPGGRMHPGYVRELVYFLIDITRQTDLQLFITTHNNDFVADFFGENISTEERKFLNEEFTLVQMQDGTVDVMSYNDAEAHLKDLHLDLRGL